MSDNINMSKEVVTIAYTGEAVDDGVMEMRDLAYSLSGLSDLFDESNRIVNGDKTVTRVKIKSDFTKGSFEVSFDVVCKNAAGILNFFGSQNYSGALNLITSIGLTVGATTYCGKQVLGFIQFIKELKNRKINQAKELENNLIEIEISENNETETIIIYKEAYDLYLDTKARKAIERTLQPLENEGIDSFEVRIKTEKEVKIIEKITKQDFENFKLEFSEKEINSYETIQYLNLISPNFSEDDAIKWKFETKGRKLFATILDTEFLKKVDKGDIAFCKGDLLKVRLFTKQIETEGLRVKEESEILEVLEHRGFKQLNIFRDIK